MIAMIAGFMVITLYLLFFNAAGYSLLSCYVNLVLTLKRVLLLTFGVMVLTQSY